jgi:hypothetical protein
MTVAEVLNRVFDSESLELKAVYKTEDEIINLVYDEAESGLKVRIANLPSDSGGGITQEEILDAVAGEVYLKAEVDSALEGKADAVNGQIQGFSEKSDAVSIASGSLTLDCAAGNLFAVSLTESVTSLSFTGVPASGSVFTAALVLTADGTARTFDWGSSVKWAEGSAPDISSENGKTDVFLLMTYDGGTAWFGFTGAQNA